MTPQIYSLEQALLRAILLCGKKQSKPTGKKANPMTEKREFPQKG
jgi:hypothetical protein